MAEVEHKLGPNSSAYDNPQRESDVSATPTTNFHTSIQSPEAYNHKRKRSGSSSGEMVRAAHGRSPDYNHFNQSGPLPVVTANLALRELSNSGRDSREHYQRAHGTSGYGYSSPPELAVKSSPSSEHAARSTDSLQEDTIEVLPPRTNRVVGQSNGVVGQTTNGVASPSRNAMGSQLTNGIVAQSTNGVANSLMNGVVDRSPNAMVAQSTNDTVGQTANGSVDHSPNGGYSPSTNYDHMAYGGYGPPEPDPEQYHPDSSPGVVVVGPKRKRNFSNRTKTGCLTCRTRKKKCDEQRPFCANCTKGGFACRGYSKSARASWTDKPGPADGGPPLQAKNGHVEVLEQPPHSGLHNGLQIDPPPLNPAPTHNGGPERPTQLRDHGNHGGYSPQQYFVPDNPPRGQQIPAPPQIEARGRPYYAAQHSWPPLQPLTTYNNGQLPRLSDIVPSEQSPASDPREMTRPTNQGTAYPPISYPPQSPYHPLHQPPPHPDDASLPHSTTSRLPSATLSTTSSPSQTRTLQSWLPAPQHETQPSYARAEAEQARPSAQVPTIAESQQSKHFNKEDIERSRMQRQSPYNHLDETLRNERARCARAVARYINACDIDSGLSPEQARDLLMMVFDPSKDKIHRLLPTPAKGLLSPGVVIEPPFRCSYGYNMHIAENVYIGDHCVIEDAAQIDIGPRTHIGSDVVIFTADVCKDQLDRKGTGAPWVAKRIKIGADVVIGRGAVIFPGVELGSSCTIGPFELVQENVESLQEVRTASTRGRLRQF
ncbi:hypothetical protein H2202_006429 [Exophiala xenobiotica]|nr:hypothetical protein H2202_006429 [Exophiala xenobiotica]KAK5204614.1 hypothetical protein LTR41_009786 [Exophiala xenobiotica]KAK5405064.1 hypothetical protein LTR06_009331 [Exophiala xenobiotica]